MDRKTAQEYIDSGQEALHLKSPKSTWGQACRVIGLDWQQTRWDKVPKEVDKGGLLIDIVTNFHGEEQHQQKVVPLNQVSARTLADFRDELKRKDDAINAEYERQRNETDVNRMVAESLVALLGT